MRARPRRPRHPLRWLVGALAAIVVAAVAVPYAYIHFVEGNAPAALSVTAGSAPATATGNVDGRWQVTQGSQAGYRVGEVLAGQNQTAVGRTNDVTGQLTVANGTVSAARFTVNLGTVKSDQSRRDAQFRGRIMDTVKYPTAVFVLAKPIPLGRLVSAAGTSTLQAAGTMTLHGTSRQVNVPLTVARNGASVQVSTQVPVLFANYGIANPSFAGFVQTQNHGTVEVLLHLAKA